MEEKSAFDTIYELVESGLDKIEEIENDVINAIQNNTFLSSCLTDDDDLSFGARIADKVAQFGGSWSFIISFFTVLVGWIILNGVLLARHPFDAYPFILLNLILSCIAAIQAPIIMMSQNRQESKDRARAENNYKVNLKTEIEVKLLHTKMDSLMEELKKIDGQRD